MFIHQVVEVGYVPVTKYTEAHYAGTLVFTLKNEMRVKADLHFRTKEHADLFEEAVKAADMKVSDTSNALITDSCHNVTRVVIDPIFDGMTIKVYTADGGDYVAPRTYDLFLTSMED